MPCLFDPPGNFDPNRFQLNLGLPDRKHKFMYPREDFHEILGEDEVERPRDVHFDGQIAPLIPVMVGRLAYHLPLLHLRLTAEILNAGDETNVGPIHLQVEVAG